HFAVVRDAGSPELGIISEEVAAGGWQQLVANRFRVARGNQRKANCALAFGCELDTCRGQQDGASRGVGHIPATLGAGLEQNWTHRTSRRRGREKGAKE